MAAEENGTLTPYTPSAAYPGWSGPTAHTLPSGAVFWLRKPQITKMIQRGQIPNPLMNVINGALGKRDQRELETEAEAKGLTVEELLEQRQMEAEAAQEDPERTPPIPRPDEVLTAEMAFGFRDVVAWATIVEPKVEMEPPVEPDGLLTASGALSFEAIDDDDLEYIVSFANGDIAKAAPFPSDGERQDPGADSGKVQHEAEPVVGHPA